MADMKVDIKVRDAVEAARGRFEYLAATAFPRAVQYSLNRVVLDGVRRFRKEMPIVLRHSNAFTLKAVRYDLDRRQTQRGTYSDTYTYAPGDTVFYPATGTYYQLYLQGTPAGSKPPNPLKQPYGSFTFPWAPVSVPVYRVLRVRADGKPGAGGLVQREMMDCYCVFGVNFTASLGNGISVGPASNVQCKTAPTGGVQFTVKVNGTIVGYIAIAAGKTIAGFATVNATQNQPINLSPGDLVEVFGPATQDIPFPDIYGYLTLVQY